MREYVREHTATLLRRLADEVHRAHVEGASDEAVHDVRVAVRRLSAGLRTFADFYPTRARKRIRRKLRELMDAAGAVRDRDIAVKLLREAGLPEQAPAIQHLIVQRKEMARQLAQKLERWKRRKFPREWRDALEL
jgi:CHAD domain-containing protein